MKILSPILLCNADSAILHNGQAFAESMGLSFMSKICGIYKITSPSGKIYIGQTSDWKHRLRVYRYSLAKGQTRLHISFKKYGIDKHKFEIIHYCAQRELNSLEVYYIQLYQCFNSEHGLNLRTGGDGGLVTQETREKQRQSALRRKPVSDETRKKMRDSQKKRPPMSVENKRKFILSNLGNKNNLGKRRAEETKLAMCISSPIRKEVINTVTGEIFPSIHRAAKSIGLHISYLSQILRGEKKNKTNLMFKTKVEKATGKTVYIADKGVSINFNITPF